MGTFGWYRAPKRRWGVQDMGRTKFYDKDQKKGIELLHEVLLVQTVHYVTIYIFNVYLHDDTKIL